MACSRANFTFLLLAPGIARKTPSPNLGRGSKSLRDNFLHQDWSNGKKPAPTFVRPIWIVNRRDGRYACDRISSFALYCTFQAQTVWTVTKALYDDWLLKLLTIHISDIHCSSRHVSCIFNLPSRNEVILSLSFIVFSFHIQLDIILVMYTNICQRTCTFSGQGSVFSSARKFFLSFGHGALYLAVKRPWPSAAVKPAWSS